MGFHDDDFSAEMCLVCGWLVKRVDRVSEDSDGSRPEYQAIAAREEYPWIHRYEAGERLPEESRGKVWQTDLAAQGVADWGELRVRGGIGQPEPPPTLERYYDGQPMTLARWPNQGFVEVRELLQPGSRDDGTPSVFGYHDDRRGPAQPPFFRQLNHWNRWPQGIYRNGDSHVLRRGLGSSKIFSLRPGLPGLRGDGRRNASARP